MRITTRRRKPTRAQLRALYRQHVCPEAPERKYMLELRRVFAHVHAQFVRYVLGRQDGGLYDGPVVHLQEVLQPRIDQAVGAAFDRMRRGIVNNQVFTNPRVLQAVQEARARNLELVRGAVGDYATDVKRVLGGLEALGKTWTELRDDLVARGRVSESRAALIARDQTTKLYGEVARITQQEAGYTHYLWVTSMDDRVRASHAANEGQVFAWDDPPPETGHPGEDINCRCAAVPVI